MQDGGVDPVGYRSPLRESPPWPQTQLLCWLALSKALMFSPITAVGRGHQGGV